MSDGLHWAKDADAGCLSRYRNLRQGDENDDCQMVCDLHEMDAECRMRRMMKASWT